MVCPLQSGIEETLECRLEELSNEVAEAFPRTTNAYRRSILTLTNSQPSIKKSVAPSRSAQQLMLAEEGTSETDIFDDAQWLPKSPLLQFLHVIDRILVAAGTVFHILLGQYLEAELGLKLLAVALFVYPFGFIDGRFHVIFHALGMCCISAIVYGSARNFETGDYSHLISSHFL